MPEPSPAAGEFVCTSGDLADGGRGVVFDVLEHGRPARAFVLRFEGRGVDERGIVESVRGDKAPAVKPGDCIVAVDPRYFRPAEVETLLGDPSKAKTELGWVPEITAQQMCAEMVAEDLKAAQQTALLRQHGFRTPVSRE